MIEPGCLCRDPNHPNPACLLHGSKSKRAERTPANKLRRRSSRRPKSGRPDDKSIDQIVSDAVQDAIKTERVRAMIEAEGNAWCEVCLKNIGTTVAAAKKNSELHHQDQRRSEGRGYDHRTHTFNRDDPEGQLIVCKGRNGCHARLERERGKR